MANIQIEILDGSKAIERKALQALAKDLNKTMDRAVNKIVVPVRQLITKSLLSQPEVSSLSGGRLAGDFGFRDGQSRISNIIEMWANSLIVQKVPVTIANGKIAKGGLILKAIPSEFKDVLNTRDAVVQTEKGQLLPWLEWLLLFGDRAIIRDFFVTFGPTKSRSRSGIAIMVGKSGARWGVPTEFAGTQNNNLVTRAMDTIGNDLTKIIQEKIEGSV